MTPCSLYKKLNSCPKWPCMSVVRARQLGTRKTAQRFKARILMQHQLDLCPACTSGVDLGTLAAKLRRRDARQGAFRAGPATSRQRGGHARLPSPYAPSSPGAARPPPPDRALAPVAHPARAQVLAGASGPVGPPATWRGGWGGEVLGRWFVCADAAGGAAAAAG